MEACWWNQSWGEVLFTAPPPLFTSCRERGKIFIKVIHHEWLCLYFLIRCYLGRGLCPALAASGPSPMMDSAEVMWLWSTVSNTTFSETNLLLLQRLEIHSADVALAMFSDTRCNTSSRYSYRRFIANVNENGPELRIYQCHICESFLNFDS